MECFGTEVLIITASPPALETNMTLSLLLYPLPVIGAAIEALHPVMLFDWSSPYDGKIDVTILADPRGAISPEHCTPLFYRVLTKALFKQVEQLGPQHSYSSYTVRDDGETSEEQYAAMLQALTGTPVELVPQLLIDRSRQFVISRQVQGDQCDYQLSPCCPIASAVRAMSKVDEPAALLLHRVDSGGGLIFSVVAVDARIDLWEDAFLIQLSLCTP